MATMLKKKNKSKKFDFKRFDLKIFFLTLGIEICALLVLIFSGLWDIVAVWDKVFLMLLSLLLLYLFSFKKI